MEDMAKYCDETVVLSDGRVFAQGSKEEIFARESELKEIGLSIPEITSVLHLLKEKGFPICEEYYTVEDAAKAVAKILKA